MKLWLIRHAPVAAAEGRCYGRSDWPAQPQATAQAAHDLAVQLPQELVVRCSPLQRCEQLAQAVQALRPDLVIKTDDRLRELDFGAWEGQPWADVSRTEIDAWLADFAHARPGGHGESVNALMARVAAVWDEAQGEARACRQDTAWITHAGVMRAALLLSRGVRCSTQASDWPADALGFGAVRVLEID
ncbi:histidine phosphatase family protein [Ottowia sp.]|uniref:histidine phosphatase family protein n=1 Tax=Ottowia sp. TaxID=1898956 RepID=UPI003A88B56A